MEKKPTIRFCGTESFISRMIPKDYFLSHQTTTGLLIQIQENRQLSDEKLETILQYFERYGSINCKEYINGQDIYVIFHHYDAVDQIMLNGEEQMIDGCTVRVQKVRVPTERRAILNSNDQEFCIHISNLSTKVTSEDLASLFNVHVANVLIRPFNQLTEHLVESQRTPYEAWIINVGNKKETQRLAKQINGRTMNNTIIRCEAIVEPLKVFELCEKFQNGKCEHSISCNMKHVSCVKSDTCIDTKCWYGHPSSRNVVSQRRPTSGR
ncbi:unnamed protein product [Rotaria sp. Silwood1]|nr:unnamed protein product [Rotaria sp. Silwood1]CAF1311656.1 unnamed protein product [Rotaria sp. Silwood1]CAF3497833.1 unnamed protein product [Rotaria sp. Silwood1]CAF3545203.1 unnamed protein product [Rotaria sp. Silwood1]CAF4614741.1 unnamed protein product [Rotaria sp. Silwood1]